MPRATCWGRNEGHSLIEVPRKRGTFLSGESQRPPSGARDRRYNADYCGCSSVDRVSASEAEGRGFDPRQPRHNPKSALIRLGYSTGRRLLHHPINGADMQDLERPPSVIYVARLTIPTRLRAVFGRQRIYPGTGTRVRAAWRSPSCCLALPNAPLVLPLAPVIFSVSLGQVGESEFCRAMQICQREPYVFFEQEVVGPAVPAAPVLFAHSRSSLR